MNVEELWGLTEWVQTEVGRRNIRDYYNNLAAAVRQNAQPNQPRTAIEPQKVQLLTALRQIDLSKLTRDQFAFLSVVGVAGYLGEEGARNVERILYEGGVDIVTAGTRLQDITGQMTSAMERFDHVRQGLSTLVKAAPPAVQINEALLRVTFTGDAGIPDVVALKEWGDKWHTIARGIAMAHDQPPEAVRVVGASKGSLVLELATALSIATTASAIIMEALKVSGRVVAILQEVQKLKTMHLGNKKIAAELKKEADKEKADGIAQISKTVIEQTGIQNNGQGDKVNALEAAIKALVSFLTQGGEVDCVVTPTPAGEDPEAAEVRGKLAETFKEIRMLERDLRRIEYKADDDREGE